MPNAQDHAFALLARQRNLLSGEAFLQAEALHRERPEQPYAQVLLSARLLPPQQVTGLLRDLARGAFACARCNLQLGYDALARMTDLRCPGCTRALAYRAEPSDAELVQRPTSRTGAVRHDPPSSGGFLAQGPPSGRHPAVRGPAPGQPSGAHPAARGPIGPPSGRHPAVPSGRPSGAVPAVPAPPPSSGAIPAVGPPSGGYPAAPHRDWDGEATVLEPKRRRRSQPAGPAPTRPPGGGDEPLIQPAAGPWDGEATVLEPHRRRKAKEQEQGTERGPLAAPPPASFAAPSQAAAPAPGAIAFDSDEETVKDPRVLEPPDTGSFTLTQIGPYALEQELGRGANAIIYLGRHKGLERRVAVKVLLGAGLLDEETVARFRLEAAVASKIDDPGIIGVYDVGQDGDHYYYAMEYCPGDTLEQRLARGPLPPQEAARVVAELASSVQAAHDHGVVHRDLKPANIILAQDSGRARITDFGVARDRSLANAMTRTGQLLGTPAYMAPEQLLGQRDVDGRADVYALGVILFECVAGRRPFEAPTAILLAEKVTREDAPPLRSLAPDAPEALELICRKALARERAARYPSARALAEDVARFQAGQRPRARRTQPGPWRWVAALVGLLALLGAIAVWAIREHQRLNALELSSDLDRLQSQLEAGVALPPEAAQEAERLRARAGEHPEQSERVEALARRVTVQLALQEARRRADAVSPLEEVEAALAQAREAAGADAALLREHALTRASLLVRRGHARQAREQLESELSRGPLPLSARSDLAWSQHLLEDEEADATLARLEEEDRAGAWGLTAAALRAARQQRWDEAGRLAERALERDGNHVEALLLQGLALASLGHRDTHEALSLIKRALGLHPDDARALYAQARALFEVRSGNLQYALETIDQAVKLSEPDTPPEFLSLRADVRLGLSRFPEAAEDLTRLLELRRDSADARWRLGLALYREGRTKDAFEQWLVSRRLDPLRFENSLKTLPEQAKVRQELGKAERER